MDRRQFLSATVAAAGTGLIGTAQAADDPHAGHVHGAAPARSPLASVFAACAAASSECVAHCQQQLATGDKAMAQCLKTSLDCDAICEAVAKLARYGSAQAPAFAKASIPAMQACAEACKPHVAHHAVCKTCYDSCQAAISAATAA